MDSAAVLLIHLLLWVDLKAVGRTSLRSRQDVVCLNAEPNPDYL